MELCLAKFEELDPVHIATALNGFFKRYITLFEYSIPSSFCPLQFQTKAVKVYVA